MAKCRNCKVKTENPLNAGIYKFCTFSCAVSFANEQGAKSRAKKVTKAKQVTVAKDKDARKALRKRKEDVKPKSKWLSELQALFNKYVRLRDKDDGCISCDKTKDWNGQYHAGHFHSRGHSSSLRFNLWNCHKQCSVCNNHLSGNIGQYTPRILEKIGIDKIDWMEENKSNISSFDVDWIKRAIKITRKAIRRLEKNI